jgi:hypothetical protein
LLQAAIRDAGRAARDVSTKLGHHPGYLVRVFSGRQPLKIQHLFAILEAVQLPAWAFFWRHYPLGGGLPGAVPGRLSPALNPEGLPTTIDLLSFVAKRQGGGDASPAALAERAARRLRFALRAGAATQRSVSEALGLGRDALGQALRGQSALTTRHLFGVLEQLEIPPARFFAELLLPWEEAAAGTVSRREVVELAEKLFTELGAAEEGRPTLRRRRADGRASAVRGEDKGLEAPQGPPLSARNRQDRRSQRRQRPIRS